MPLSRPLASAGFLAMGLILAGCATTPVTFSCASDPNAPIAQFAGDWTTQWGPIRIHGDPRSIQGEYYPDYHGSFTGSVTGNTLDFNWSEKSQTGAGRFVMCPGGNSFSGAWGFGVKPLAYPWNGTRVGLAPSPSETPSSQPATSAQEAAPAVPVEEEPDVQAVSVKRPPPVSRTETADELLP